MIFLQLIITSGVFTCRKFNTVRHGHRGYNVLTTVYSTLYIGGDGVNVDLSTFNVNSTRMFEAHTHTLTLVAITRNKLLSNCLILVIKSTWFVKMLIQGTNTVIPCAQITSVIMILNNINNNN